MGSKTFHSLWDFVRHGMNIELSCRNGHCQHRGIVAAHDAVRWFKLHRWPDSLEGFGGSALDHFYCTRCRARAGRAKPTEVGPTVTNFFPVDDRGWSAIQRRLRR